MKISESFWLQNLYLKASTYLGILVIYVEQIRALLPEHEVSIHSTSVKNVENSELVSQWAPLLVPYA